MQQLRRMMPRNAPLVLLAATAAASSTTLAFTASSPSARRALASRAIGPASSYAARFKNSHAPRQLGLNMIFGKFFRDISGGGAFAAGIDYSELDHPGQELIKAAEENRVLVTSAENPNLSVATFAGGCFWGLELAYQRVPGVVHTAVGYTQGPEKGPTYTQVCAGATGHTEAIIVYYDPSETSYDTLLDTFFGRVDPTTANGQGNDFGRQYRTGVYFHTKEQENAARARFGEEKLLYSSKTPIATELKAAMPFWPAEKYHQQYLSKGGQNAEKGATETVRCYG